MKNLELYNWTTILFKCLLNVNKTIVKNTIAVGAWDFMNMSREQMLFEHDITLKLTKKEVEWIRLNLDLTKYTSILGILDDILIKEPGKGQALSNKNRKNIIKGLQNLVVKPPYSVKYTSIDRICALENSYLGTTLSVHRTDSAQEEADTTLKELEDGKTGDVKVIVEIEEIKEHITKKSQQVMAFIVASDQTATLGNMVIFSNVYTRFKNVLFEGNTCLLYGKLGDKGGFIINAVKQV